MPKLNTLDRYTKNRVKTYLSNTYGIDKKDIIESDRTDLNPDTSTVETTLTLHFSKDGKSFNIYSTILVREPYKLLYYQLWNYIISDEFKQYMKEQGFYDKT